MVSYIRSSLLCSLALLASYTNASDDLFKRQDASPSGAVSYVTVTVTQPPVTVTTCCTGTITHQVTTVITGPTYTAGTTVTHQVDYFSYWIQGNSTISSETASTVNTTFISNTIPHVGPSTAIAGPLQVLNSLPSPCTTTVITQTLSFDPVKQTAVYYRDRVETEFTIPTTTETPTATQAPVVQIQDGQVQNQQNPAAAPTANNETSGTESAAAAESQPPAAQAIAPIDRVSKFALGIFIGGAIIALL